MGGSVYPQLLVPFFAGVRVKEPRQWRAWLSRGWIQRSKKIICVSQDVADWCHRVEGAPLSKLVVIPNGITLREDESLTSDPRFSTTDRILLFVGRLVKQKGIDGLMSHAQRLLEELPEHRLVFLGDGPMRAWCQSQARAMACSDRIHFHGQCDSVPAWMQHSELLLHPARYEGMPNVVLEAMASGLPVVAFRVEGIRELLGDGFLDQTAPIGDWDDWLSRVVRLATDATLRRSLGTANRTRAESSFRLEDQLAKYLEVWSASNAGC
jgi:glycosyltransferase involved in cell wall biosynthesis